MIQARAVSKVFPATRRGKRDIHALDSVTLDVSDNEFFCLLGPSGCGKSTLLRLIAGLGLPTSGEILIDQRPVKAADPNVLMVWQEFALLDWRTVEGNVAFGLEVNDFRKSDREQIVERMLDIVGLTNFRHSYPTELSGGMKQRVGLARALALDPDVLLMDEPFGALDAQTRMLMQDEILRLWAEFKKTVVFVTHSIEEAVLLGDRVAVFEAHPGRVKEVVEIDLPRPRPPDIRSTASFGQLYDRLYRLLRDEVLQSISNEAASGSH